MNIDLVKDKNSMFNYVYLFDGLINLEFQRLVMFQEKIFVILLWLGILHTTIIWLQFQINFCSYITLFSCQLKNLYIFRASTS